MLQGAIAKQYGMASAENRIGIALVPRRMLPSGSPQPAAK